MRPGTVTGFLRDPMLAGAFKFTTGRGALMINRTTHALPYITFKRRASALPLIGSAHTAQKRGNRLGQPDRHKTARIVSFRPIKRDTKKRTTGTARQAFITHRTPASKRIRLKRNYHVSHPFCGVQDVKNKFFLMHKRAIDVGVMFRLVNGM